MTSTNRLTTVEAFGVTFELGGITIFAGPAARDVINAINEGLNGSGAPVRQYKGAPTNISSPTIQSQLDFLDSLRDGTQHIVSVDSPLSLANIKPQLGDKLYYVEWAGGKAKGLHIQVVDKGDPRLMCVGELFLAFGGLTSLYPNAVGRAWNRYHNAVDAWVRPKVDERQMLEDIELLQAEGLWSKRTADPEQPQVL